MMHRYAVEAGHVDRPRVRSTASSLSHRGCGLLDCPRKWVVQDPERMLREPCACLWSTPCFWVRVTGAHRSAWPRYWPASEVALSVCNRVLA